MDNKPNFPDMPYINGLKIATAKANIKYSNRTDLLCIFFTSPTQVSGVFTQSLCPSAPVDHCRLSLPQGKAKALIVNSGNANAFTGKKGYESCQKIAETTANLLNCKKEEIFLASTGVIGEPLDHNKITSQLASLYQQSCEQTSDWHDAAKAIMTTDLFAKGVSKIIKTPQGNIIINAIAKGAGMIAPNMATMLCFIFTDAVIPNNISQKLLKELCDVTFNAITVDSDTSTSDSVLFFSVGENGVKITNENDDIYSEFSLALKEVMLDLALKIVQDGEGAEKLIKIEVNGAKTTEEAKKVAFSIANSPLVKTAIAGEDANWGRVVMAVGKSGQTADRDKLAIYFGDHCVAENGERSINYCENTLSSYMKNKEITIKVNLNIGNSDFTVWTCDLTEEYIKINADYRS
ncbi:bifunctional glutamate N-acetyltransferase/amino-acid acetyltransferase ArgJ [Bartonella sp. DGB1]|uniref:bifunctional glutamate N-acetyltransferase/amino-acid acetyltransferase ArgJ n=1 Tax=Bartonella sp. DGB1 TaxID=3239807 RepID=UPI0035265CBB